MNLTPLALAAAYAALRGGNKEEVPAVAPAAVPAPAPTAQIPARTDMTQMFGATQDTEDMEAGPAAGQAPSVMTKKNPSFKQAFSEARLAGDKTFQWNGKPYTTELADKTTPAKVKPSIDQSQAETNRLKSQDKFATGVPVSPTVTPTTTENKTNPETKKIKKTYRGLDGKVHTYEEKPEETSSMRNPKTGRPYAKGGKIKAYAKGGTVSASKRGDGIAQRGHTKGRLV